MNPTRLHRRRLKPLEQNLIIKWQFVGGGIGIQKKIVDQTTVILVVSVWSLELNIEVNSPVILSDC